jgi:chemotaxis protein MotB
MARKNKHGAHAAHDNDERWLLTYADMITLLMALFMVLFSISSVNISKYQTLQESLRAAFSGSILPGGQALQNAGSTPSKNLQPNFQIQQIVPATPTLGTPQGSTAAQKAAQKAAVEQSQFVDLRARLEAYAQAHGFAKQVQVTISQSGLQVQVLTDRLLFNSGSDALNAAGLPLLGEIAQLLNQASNPIDITGYTDSVPTDTAQFPNNLFLSSGRADTVEGFMLSRGVPSTRVFATGRGALDPVASNATNPGRALNRRVVIELVRT